MELQGLQEALKVEIQCHQKLAVRGCPVGAVAKPLSLIKPSGGQSIAISVVPANAKAPVSMVTAATHINLNGQKGAETQQPSSLNAQATPINLQTGGRSMHPYSRHSQVRPKTLIPDSLPSPLQPLSLTRGGAATLVLSPQSQLHSQGHSHSQNQYQIQSQGPSLPTANSTFSPERLHPNGQPPQPADRSPTHASNLNQAAVVNASATLTVTATATTPNVPPSNASATVTTPMPVTATATPIATVTGTGVVTPGASPGVAYAIISTPTVAAGNGVATAISEAVKVQPLLFSTDNKVIIIQPQVHSSSQDSPAPQTDSQSRDSGSSAPPSPAKQIKEDKDVDPEKIAFMVALGLVTTEHMEEIQIKRQERKRRSTANPTYSGLFEPERKRLASNYLSNPLFLSTRDPEDLCWKEELEHDEQCAVCREEGDLQLCSTCPRAYHPDCLHPPLRTPPKGLWMCPKCQKKVLNKENMAWPHNFVQSYVTHKSMKEDEKRKLLRRSCELKKECTHLQEQDQRLSSNLLKCMDLKDRLLGQQRETQASLERLKALIRLIQRDQVIQVTMTATTNAGASLLSLPWIKPANSSSSSSTGASSTNGASSTHGASSAPSVITVPSMGPGVLLQKNLSQPQPQGN
ncbi:PHD finger protein 21B [Engraulis encrasicolus]|uniref:PHD finger protein 21B n=1 Tax=Engraulis encrasicolus TaxID=184585 RepID=UPI002FD4E1FA